MASSYKWEFASRFRSHAFGWRSDTPIQRIKEALAEIKKVGKKEPVLAAEGAIILLEKLSPALMQVDSSSGAIGSWVNRAIDTLVPIISNADVDQKIRQRWLDRLWQALENDEMPYIESLGDYWGELCANKETAAVWADRFLPLLEHAWNPKANAQSYFTGTSACLSALYASGRFEQLLNLVDRSPYKWWRDRQWGVKALVSMGKRTEALRYAEASRGRNDPGWQIAQVCEAILLSSDQQDDAYSRYAIEANQSTTNLSTFRAIAKKYPNIPSSKILHDLVASTPGAEGKWFAAAKHAELFDVAIELVTRSPTDPRTLARAARDHGVDKPDFAMASGLAAIRWISLGYGYEINSIEVLEAYDAVMQATHNAGVSEQSIKTQIIKLIDESPANSPFMKSALSQRLTN